MSMKKNQILIEQKILSITNLNYYKSIFFFLNYSKFFFNNNFNLLLVLQCPSIFYNLRINIYFFLNFFLFISFFYFMNLIKSIYLFKVNLLMIKLLKN